MVADPLRSCVGCRRRRPQRELLRFRADERGRLRMETREGSRGRCAYVCADRACLARASKHGGFSRALRHGVAFDPDRLVGRIVDDLRVFGDELIAQYERDGRAQGTAARDSSDEESSCSRRLLVWRRDTWRMTEPRAARRMVQIEQFVTSLLEQ